MGVEQSGTGEYSFCGQGRQPSQARSARGTRRAGEAEGPNEQDRGRELLGHAMSEFTRGAVRRWPHGGAHAATTGSQTQPF